MPLPTRNHLRTLGAPTRQAEVPPPLAQNFQAFPVLSLEIALLLLEPPLLTALTGRASLPGRGDTLYRSYPMRVP
jgi:hypothetical protein